MEQPVKKKSSLSAQALGFLLGGAIVGFSFTLGAHYANWLIG